MNRATLDSPQSQDVEAIFRVIRDEAAKRELAATLHTHLLTRQNERLVILPVYLEGDLDAYDVASALQDLEDAWNNQEPRPRLRLFITPASR